MLIQEVRTDQAPVEVVRLAKEFFLTRFSPYGADVENEGDEHVTFHFEAGELVIGATTEGEGRTLVRGSTSRLHHELSQFLISLGGVAEDVRQNQV